MKNGINLLTASVFTYFILKGLLVEFSAICKTPYLLMSLLKFYHYFTRAVWRHVLEVANIQRVVFPVTTSDQRASKHRNLFKTSSVPHTVETRQKRVWH
jgi:hypothetical protein